MLFINKQQLQTAYIHLPWGLELYFRLASSRLGGSWFYRFAERLFLRSSISFHGSEMIDSQKDIPATLGEWGS
ncbi:MAG: hypothetical protein AAFN10_00340 [Bacteroidota bacterium]